MTASSTFRHRLPRRGAAARVALLSALLLTGCVAVPSPPPAPPVLAPPVTGVDREHEQLVASFGGEYRAPRTQMLLEEITGRLVAATERPEERYRITILDSPAVNAFALPTGRLYVTRGLLALANDTSELAAVMAHEIAHVTLRHAAARTELEARSALVTRVVSDVLRDQSASARIRDASRYEFARFSRAQELEADAVSVRTLDRAGFDPFGATRFLTALERFGDLQAALPGAERQPTSLDRLATHPATTERIVEARAAARRIGAPGLREGDRERFLAAIDGIAFGDDPRDGLVVGNSYVNARLAIAFSAPSGFTLDNSSRAVLGASADGARRLMFDAVEASPGRSLEDVVRATWTDDIETRDVVPRRVNGLDAAVGTSIGREWHFRVAAIRAPSGTYRLIVAHRPGDGGANAAFEQTLASVRNVPQAELAALPRLRVRVVTAHPGDTVETLGRRMRTANPVETFRVLNGLFDTARVEPGRSYKIVVP